MQMSQFALDYSPTTHPPPPALDLTADSRDSFHRGFKAEKDDRASLSGSEDGSFVLYGDGSKHEDLEEENTALTSQTLNADGTPKRPMNAFMIFARRRRPQVSSENQSMRTGDISKILSKEWTSMPAQDKQFYLDQAKHLKEAFNSKYPDYVYRRRPNNSRKRRRPDGGPGARQSDNPLPSELGDEYATSTELGESSPTDTEDYLSESVRDTIQYSRPPNDLSQSYVDHHNKYSSSQSRAAASGYPYASEASGFRPSNGSGNNGGRLTFASGTHHDSLNNHNLSSTTTLPSPRHQNPISFDYLSSQASHHAHTHTPPLYDQVEVPDSWQTSPIDRGNTWSNNSQDRVLAGMVGHKSSHYPMQGGGGWPNTATSLSAQPTINSSAQFFPTLTSPYDPSPNHLQGGYSSNAASSQGNSQNGSSPPQQQFPSSTNHIQPGREFEDRGYTSSPSVSPVSAYPPNSNRDAALSYFERPASLSRGLPPPVQSISGYSHSQPLHSSGASPHGYWQKGKMENF